MKSNKIKVESFLALAAVIVFSGCATGASKTLDQKLSQKPEVTSSADLGKEAQNTIDQDTHLTPDQKAQLTQLRVDTSAKLTAIRKESLQLRDLVIKDFAAENDAELDLIRTRMTKLNKKQVSVLFDAVAKANKIIGHIPRNPMWLNSMMTEERADTHN